MCVQTHFRIKRVSTQFPRARDISAPRLLARLRLRLPCLALPFLLLFRCCLPPAVTSVSGFFLGQPAAGVAAAAAAAAGPPSTSTPARSSCLLRCGRVPGRRRWAPAVLAKSQVASGGNPTPRFVADCVDSRSLPRRIPAEAIRVSSQGKGWGIGRLAWGRVVVVRGVANCVGELFSRRWMGFAAATGSVVGVFCSPNSPNQDEFIMLAYFLLNLLRVPCGVPVFCIALCCPKLPFPSVRNNSPWSRACKYDGE